MNRCSIGHIAKRTASRRCRQRDRLNLLEALHPTWQVVNMPNATRLLAGAQELAGKIEQRLNRSAGCYGDTQIWAAKQRPPVIMINCAVSKIKRRLAHIPAAVIECEKEPARQGGESGIGTEPGIQFDHQGPDVNQATANPGERRGDDIADEFMGVRRQKARPAHSLDKALGHWVGQATKLHAGAGGQLDIAAAELLCDPAQPAKRGTGRLAARNPNPYHGTVLCQMRPEHPRAAVGGSHARHRK